MINTKCGEYIISGYINGQKFRPSNWSERLCEAGATFDPMKRVMRYSEHFYPRQCETHGCSVYVNFESLDGELVRYINWFIDSNGLDVVLLQSIQQVPQAGLTEVSENPSINDTPFSSTPAKYSRRSKAAA